MNAGYGAKVVLQTSSSRLLTGERIGLLGVKGAGKSTLVKTIAGVLPAVSGSATFNKGLEVGYSRAHQVEMLRDDECALAPERIAESRSGRGAAQYSAASTSPATCDRSGGEFLPSGREGAARLALIVWQRPNLLAARRADQPPRPRHARGAGGGAGAVRGHPGAGVAPIGTCCAPRPENAHRREAALREFDGDLDDYRDWLLKKD